MRRSAAPSLKFGTCAAVDGSNDESQKAKKVVPFLKATRTTENILSLLNAVDDEGSESASDLTSVGKPISHHKPPGSLKSKLKVPSCEDVSNEEMIVRKALPNNEITHNIRVFNVVWGKQSTKKHKTWEGDGILEVSGKNVVLKDTEGKILGHASRKTVPLEEGSRLFVGNKEVEIIDAVLCVQNEQNEQTKISSKRTAEKAELQGQLSKRAKASKTFLVPLKNACGPAGVTNYAPLVMPQPPHVHQWQYNTASLPITDVAVDSFLVRVLRPHQREGVVFLYECIMGMHKLNFNGAILADEMGLGKTLQCIALIWTLLKKGPYGGNPILKYVLVVTPSSLVSNWEKEFLLWLGRERISLFVINQKNKPRDYGKYRKESVMLISYEMFSRYSEDILDQCFDLLICDEGHRLKNSSIKISNLLTKLKCSRKIILTGTPVQNDLQEFFALIDFVNPGILNSVHEFHQYFERPIVASHQPNADEQTKELGEIRTSELNSATKWFILRRTQEVINKFLPTKEECVVFCTMSPLQKELYKAALSYWVNREELYSIDNVAHLSVITALKKICNHPSLVWHKSESVAEYLGQFCENRYTFSVDHSGKLVVLLKLLQHIFQRKEKTVVVSYYTQTLDMLADVLTQEGLKYCRLDGSVPSGQRQKIVDQFNSCYSNHFVFLLSARAGGVGLNLTGASRLVLYDCDWNPATDLQAMSRIWRDGQKRVAHIYRLLTTGSIEEKMFQRQLSKTSLGGAVVDPCNNSSIKLSNEELKVVPDSITDVIPNLLSTENRDCNGELLEEKAVNYPARDLFTMQECISCLTHDLLRCKCPGSGEAPGPPSHLESFRNNSSDEFCLLRETQKTHSQIPYMNELFKWEHHGQPFNAMILKAMGLSDSMKYITYIFRNTSCLSESEYYKNNTCI